MVVEVIRTLPILCFTLCFGDKVFGSGERESDNGVRERERVVMVG